MDLFKQGIKVILDEYFNSGVVEEVARALTDLDHAEFHHEFVKQVISRYVTLHFRNII